MDNELDGFVPYEGGTPGVPGSNKFTGKSGGYVFTVGENSDHYVGSTANLAGRISTGLSNLKHNKHNNRKLQEAYNKNPSVTAWVQPTDTVEEARRLEQKTVNKLLPTGKLANRGVEDVTRPHTGLTHSEESRLKNQEAHLGKHHSEESRLKMSQARLGIPRSEEVKQKLAATSKEYYSTDEGKATRARVIEKTKKPVNCYGITYPSLTEAAKALGVTHVTIIDRCKSDKYPDFFKVTSSAHDDATKSN